MTTSDQSSDTSAPSVLIASDDAGNLDGGWLSTNYPTTAPLKQINLARAKTLGDVLTYVLAGNTPPRYRGARDFIVPALTDMAGVSLPRFPTEVQSAPKGLLVEPASANLLVYDRLGLSTGITLTGASVSKGTRLSVDGQSQVAGIANATTLDYHGVSLTHSTAIQGDVSVSLALFSATQRYFVLTYVRNDGVGGAGAIIDLNTMQLKAFSGKVLGSIVQDWQGWYWVQFAMGGFGTAATGTLYLQCAADATGTNDYQDTGNLWFVDALQLENLSIPSTPMLAATSGPVSRGVETVQTAAPVTNLDNWLDTNTQASTTLIEGYLPNYLPASGVVVELARFQANAQQYVVIGYTSDGQLGLFVTNNSSSPKLVSAVSLAAGSVYHLAIAQSANQLTGFAVNGKTSLSFGTLLNFTLPVGVTASLQLGSGAVPASFARLVGYAQALSAAQLKYLTSV